MRIVNRSEKEAHIMQAAISAFAQNGYEKTSISDIAIRAGIATEGFIIISKTRKSSLSGAASISMTGLPKGWQIQSQGEQGISCGSLCLAIFRTNIEYARILLMEAKFCHPVP